MKIIEMEKYLFYPLWKVDELEQKLHDFELQGWRLIRVSSSYYFDFVESAPRDVEYVITYCMARDNKPGMYEQNRILLSKYSANEIPREQTGLHVFRITSDQRDLDEIKEYRDNYFRHVLFHYMLISLEFFAAAVFMFISVFLMHDNLISKIITGIVTAITFAYFVYRLYGYIVQIKKIKGGFL